MDLSLPAKACLAYLGSFIKLLTNEEVLSDACRALNSLLDDSVDEDDLIDKIEAIVERDICTKLVEHLNVC